MPDVQGRPRPPDDELDELEVAVLAFERQWWQRPGSKDQAVRDLFGLTPTAYYARLNRLIDRPSALVEAPDVVNRLRQRREAGRARRARGWR